MIGAKLVAAAIATLVVALSFDNALVTGEHLAMVVVGIAAALTLANRIGKISKRLDELEKGPEPSGSIPFAGKKPAAPPADPSNRPKRKRRS